MNRIILLLTGSLWALSNLIYGCSSEYNVIEKYIDDAELNTSLQDICAVPSAIVGGAVNVITGNYVESHCDLTIPGANSLQVQRLFNSGCMKEGSLCHGWNLNLPSDVQIHESPEKKISATVHDRGATFMFKHSPDKDRMRIRKKQLRYGVTNCSSGVLSSLNNIKNKRLYYRDKARHCELHDESGEILLYKRTTESTAVPSYAISEIILPNGCSLTYDYKHVENKEDRIERIVARGRNKKTLSSVTCSYSKNYESKPDLTLISSDERKVEYKFIEKHRHSDDRHYLLKSVQSDHAPKVTYKYSDPAKHKPERLLKKSLPDDRYRSIEYYEKGDNNVLGNIINVYHKDDSRVGRVSSLFAPAGADSSPVRIWSFRYNLHKDHHSRHPFGGTTEVIDALGRKKIYRFSDEQRLTSVTHFLDDGQPYRKEILIWEETGKENTFLQARGLIDDQGSLLMRRNYTYDERGNVLKESMYGNLSGSNEDDITWDSYRKGECYAKTFTYNQKGLLRTEDDGRKHSHYKYIKGTNLLGLKLVSDNSGIRERYQYTYDVNGTLIKEICDDGSSEDFNDLSAVTVRLIKKISPTKHRPIGLPGVIEEYFFNLNTNQEELLSRIENKYSRQGHLLCQKTYDCNGDFSYLKEWSYDSFGNVVQEIDPLGQITTYKYDKNNNLIYQQTSNLEFHTEYTYDFVNRLIREDKVFNYGENGSFLVNAYSYDYMGNCIAKTDKYHNTINYIYDEFSRLIERIYPSTLNVKGHFFNARDIVSYDCLNNPCVKTDSNGHSLKRKYTAWGKPYIIEYPDGMVEKCIYDLDGTLVKTIDSKAVTTVFTHDYKGRKISEEKISAEGVTLSLQQWIYNSFHLIEEFNPAGMKTVYSYDHAGRLSKVQKGDAETQYMYDKLGRQSEVWESYGYEKFRKSIYEFDHLDRIVHETIIDECGNTFTKKSYKFDQDGNRTHIILDDDMTISCTEIKYDSDKKPLQVILPDGTATNYTYDYNYKNAHGQIVGFEKETDANGNQTIIVMDSCGRKTIQDKKDSLGVLLQRSTYKYDGEGNLTRREDCIVKDGIAAKSINIDYSYDSQNRVVSVVEAAGDPFQKITRNKYYTSGELSKIIKPDGIEISHKYDDLGRLVEMHSSDDSVHYIYKYDQNNNVIQVSDLISGLETYRIIDENNRMTYEELGTGLKFLYQYDPRSRVTQVILPDMSSIEYLYNAVNLQTILRKKGDSSYSFNYHFNNTGKITKIDLPNPCGSIDYAYDSCLRPIGITSKYWSQTIPDGGYDPCGSVLKVIQNDTVGEFTSNYTYDTLYHLISESGSGSNSYEFDSLHNRIRKNGILNIVNSLNQLTKQDDKSYTYDLNGNQSGKSTLFEKTEYRYDALDRLTAIISEGVKTEYLYDCFHRRLKKTSFQLHNDNWIETDTQTFLYQGDKEIGVLDKNSQVIEMRTLGLGIDGEIGAAVVLEIQDQIFYPLHDFRGNVSALISALDGKIVESYRYTAYGENQVFDSNGNAQTSALSPWRFSSKRIDPETGWVYFGRRYYDSEVGKWTSPDPLGYIDSSNVYCFVRNRPLKYIDPDGRAESDIFETGCNYEWWANTIQQCCYHAAEWEDDPNMYQIGTHYQYSSTFTVGTPMYSGVELVSINGMLNDLKDAKESAQIMSDMAGGHLVHGVHNQTYGVLDLFECALGLMGVSTRPVDLLVQTLNECDKKSEIMLSPHSQGGIHTRNALPSLDEELRQRLLILAIAPADLIPKGMVREAKHYISRDIVPLVGMLWNQRLPENMEPVIVLKPHPEAGLIDHARNSKTYEPILKLEIGSFIDKYGRKL